MRESYNEYVQNFFLRGVARPVKLAVLNCLFLQEFFERKRHTGIGRGGMAKRLRTSSPPMNVQYKKLVSQDLISLRALQETCDDHNIIGNEVRYIIALLHFTEMHGHGKII